MPGRLIAVTAVTGFGTVVCGVFGDSMGCPSAGRPCRFEEIGDEDRDMDWKDDDGKDSIGGGRRWAEDDGRLTIEE